MFCFYPCIYFLCPEERTGCPENLMIQLFVSLNMFSVLYKTYINIHNDLWYIFFKGKTLYMFDYIISLNYPFLFYLISVNSWQLKLSFLFQNKKILDSYLFSAYLYLQEKYSTLYYTWYKVYILVYIYVALYQCVYSSNKSICTNCYQYLFKIDYAIVRIKDNFFRECIQKATDDNWKQHIKS